MSSGFIRGLCLIPILFVSIALAKPMENDVVPTLTPSDALSIPLEDMRKWESLSLYHVKATPEWQSMLKKVQKLPKLKSVTFSDSDLAAVTPNDPVFPSVETVVLGGGCRISQGTIDWLAKFPSGTSVVFGCDVRGLTFGLGKFSYITFDNCKLSRSAVLPLIEKHFQVTFKEVTVSDENK